MSWVKDSLNGRLKLIGAVVLALGAVFGALRALPWATKDEVAGMEKRLDTQIQNQDKRFELLREDIKGAMDEVRKDIRELRQDLRQGRR